VLRLALLLALRRLCMTIDKMMAAMSTTATTTTIAMAAGFERVPDERLVLWVLIFLRAGVMNVDTGSAGNGAISGGFGCGTQTLKVIWAFEGNDLGISDEYEWLFVGASSVCEANCEEDSKKTKVQALREKDPVAVMYPLILTKSVYWAWS
jgi:hypothetical protein